MFGAGGRQDRLQLRVKGDLRSWLDARLEGCHGSPRAADTDALLSRGQKYRRGPKNPLRGRNGLSPFAGGRENGRPRSIRLLVPRMQGLTGLFFATCSKYSVIASI